MSSSSTTEQQQLTECQNEYKEFFTKAEAAIKFATMATPEGVSVPAINQLRYAGKHVARSFDCTGAMAVHEMTMAVHHTKRAVFDAMDATAQYYLERCRQYESEYRSVNIVAFIPSYIVDAAKMDEIVEAMTKEDIARFDPELDDVCDQRCVSTIPPAYISQKEQQIEDLKEIHHRWKAARANIDAHISRERRKDRILIAGLIVAILTLLVALRAGC